MQPTVWQGRGVGDVITLRRVTEEDWARLRDVRLEMLADTPTAYLETLADAQARDEAEWRFRARRGADGQENFAVAASDPAGGDRWVAYMACFMDAPGRAHLVSVYVAPAQRGSGLAERMVAEVCRWARDAAGADRLHLYVHEDNGRALSFYRRLGFTETGGTMPYDLDPTKLEIEMEMFLTG